MTFKLKWTRRPPSQAAGCCPKPPAGRSRRRPLRTRRDAPDRALPGRPDGDQGCARRACAGRDRPFGECALARFDRRFGDLESRIEATAGQPAADRAPGTRRGAPERLAASRIRARCALWKTRCGSGRRGRHLLATGGSPRHRAMAQIEERLDEISRAIVASAESARLDPQPFERIEAPRRSPDRGAFRSRAADRAGRAGHPAVRPHRCPAARSALPDEAVEHAPAGGDDRRAPRPAFRRADLRRPPAGHRGALRSSGMTSSTSVMKTPSPRPRLVRPPRAAARGHRRAHRSPASRRGPFRYRWLAQRIELMTLRLDQAPPAGGLEPDLVRNLEAHATALSHQLAQAGPTGAERRFDRGRGCTSSSAPCAIIARAWQRRSARLPSRPCAPWPSISPQVRAKT